MITVDPIRLILVVGITACLSLFVLEILPDGFFAGNPYLNASLSFGLLAVFGFALIRYFRLGTLEYFRLPQITKSTMVAVALVALLTVPPIFLVDREGKSLFLGLLAILFVFSVGLGEEIFSRGFHYGFLEKYGRYLALVVSSLIFGLMHLNRYVGDNWHPWRAYGHVITAFAFGLLACALMMVTKSIWVAVIFHTLANWDLAFNKVSPVATLDLVSDNFFVKLLMPLMYLFFYGLMAFLLLWFGSDGQIKEKTERVLISLKLVDSTNLQVR